MRLVPLGFIEGRALAAYARTDGEPLPTSVRAQKIGALRYVLLHNGKTLLACYRVRNDGKLKRLVRLPAELT